MVEPVSSEVAREMLVNARTRQEVDRAIEACAQALAVEISEIVEQWKTAAGDYEEE